MSAYRGDNSKIGKLGVFLEFVKKGLVPPGSSLRIESGSGEAAGVLKRSKTSVSTEKRDRLACGSMHWVEALSELDVAEEALRDSRIRGGR